MNKNEIKTKIINCDDKRKENTKVQNPIWSRRIIITSRSGTKNLMNHQSDIGKLYVYAIYPTELNQSIKCYSTNMNKLV